MNLTEEAFESFIKWGHYNELLDYYYKTPNKIQINLDKEYSKLLSYKVADLLINEGYILPLEKKRLPNSKKITIPRVDIQKIGSHKINGDIDVLAFSKYTNTLLNIEYKNFQMGITTSNYINSEINRGTRKEYVKKALCREKELSNIHNELKILFEDKIGKNYKIKTIILSSNPNYYFNINDKDNEFYDFFDWKKFYELIQEKKL